VEQLNYTSSFLNSIPISIDPCELHLTAHVVCGLWFPTLDPETFIYLFA
jgi:hypothetical protein